MIESLEISNFRGFSNLILKNLSRVNIIVGDNGSGKTALLESLFLAGGLGPEIYLRTRAWRGAGEKMLVSLERDQYEALWKEIFYGLDQNQAVIIRFIDSISGERQLRIYYDAAQTHMMPLDIGKGGEDFRVAFFDRCKHDLIDFVGIVLKNGFGYLGGFIAFWSATRIARVSRLELCFFPD
jgi:hypothetical protein